MAIKRVCDKCKKEEVLIQENELSAYQLPDRWGKANVKLESFGHDTTITLLLCPVCAEPFRAKHEAIKDPKYSNTLANIMYDIACDALSDAGGA